MKISKGASKRHDDALALLSMSRALTDDEVEKVYTWYNPMATNNVGKCDIYFTPPGLARDFGMLVASDGSLVDLCAGIGVLSYYARMFGNVKRHVAIEIAPEFVDVGRKLLPDVEWILGNVFDQQVIAGIGLFDMVISNPPFGSVPSAANTSWLATDKGPARWKVVEIMVRIGGTGAAILPEKEHDYAPRPSKDANGLREKLDLQFSITPMSIDATIYADDWQGAKPCVEPVEVSCEDGRMPIGMPRTRKAPEKNMPLPLFC